MVSVYCLVSSVVRVGVCLSERRCRGVCAQESAGGAGNTKVLKVLRLMRLAKLLRLARVKRLFERLEREYKEVAQVARMAKILGAIIFTSHFVACVWCVHNT